MRDNTITAKKPSGGKAAELKRRRAQVRVAQVKDRRRFKTTPVPLGSPAKVAPADAVGTIFRTRVSVPNGAERVLKDGLNNAKIGGQVLVGRLKGAHIATLTLEERATCPTTCHMWRGCYGNSMQHARRWTAGPALEAQLQDEVADLCVQHTQVLVRLHVLGDFYSLGYLKVWDDMLAKHGNLSAFGFTAWQAGTKIGDEVVSLRSAYPDRFMIRHSGRTGRWGSFTLPFPTDTKQIGDAIVCPEQLDAMEGSPQERHCGNCAVCWSTDAPIAFVEH